MFVKHGFVWADWSSFHCSVLDELYLKNPVYDHAIVKVICQVSKI